jgi:hypothetical protein
MPQVCGNVDDTKEETLFSSRSYLYEPDIPDQRALDTVP